MWGRGTTATGGAATSAPSRTQTSLRPASASRTTVRSHTSSSEVAPALVTGTGSPAIWWAFITATEDDPVAGSSAAGAPRNWASSLIGDPYTRVWARHSDRPA